MVKNRINKIFSSRIFYIIFSILAAVALWLYIEYRNDNEISVPISGIPVQLVGESTLEDRNLIITNVDLETVTLRFNGKRSIIQNLSREDILVKVDLSPITSNGVFQLAYDVVYNSNINENNISVSRGSTNTVTITVSKMIERVIPVDGIYNGGVQEGFVAGALEFNPNTVTVSGPEETVSQINAAWVTIQRENLSKTVVENMEFVFRDANGDIVDTENLTCSDNTVSVTIPVNMQKEVSLVVDLTDGAGATPANISVDINPPKILLSGDAEILQNLNQIVLGKIDLSKFSLSTKQTFPIVIPNNTTNLTGVTEATVSVEVTGLATTQISATNISAINNTEGYNVTIITQSLDIWLRGKENAINSVSDANIRIEADLSSLGEATGMHSVPANVYIDGFSDSDLGVTGEYSVNVQITN